MKLSELGEDGLVRRLTGGLPLGREVIVGAGDDCAVLGKPEDRRWLLLKTDAVVEGVHFRREEKMERVGWKALCRTISDIAAMGGVPAHGLISLAASPTMEVEQLDALYVGLCRAAEAFGVGLVGGETSRSQGGLFLSITLTGWVEPERCLLRSGGKPGDAIYVTGSLGGSQAGKHLDFTPRLQEALWLAEHFKPSAMMDLSDGLGQDLPRLAAASECLFEIDESALPCTSGCSPQQAIADGEDFELLFTIGNAMGEQLVAAWPSVFPTVPLTRIGRLLPRAGIDESTSLSSRLAHGFDHFA